MKQYILNKKGNLYTLDVLLQIGNIRRKQNLIVDTGASKTIISRFTIEAMGYDILETKKFQRFVTASGTAEAPMVCVDKFFCLGKQIDNYEVVAYDLPRESLVNGLLGMDFMTMFDISISTKNGTVIVK